jgi:hypothetical protein
MTEQDFIGVATMEANGTIVLSLRAHGPAGAVGHGMIRYPPTHEDYHRILTHLGGIAPSEEKPVRAFPETDTHDSAGGSPQA